jgi:hypothetical protein
MILDSEKECYFLSFAHYFKKPGFMTRFILHAPFLPLAFPHHEQPQAMDGALEGLADETGDLPLH